MRPSSRSLLGLNIATLTLLTAQGWTGDFVNLFAVFPSGSVGRTLSGFTQALSNAGRMEVTHAVMGTVLIALAISIVVIAFRFGASTTRICACLGFLAVCSAAYGGLSFVLSGFQNNGSSAQMGGSFIGSYASYFLVLYFNRS
jgi:hypothetical protein